MDVRLEVRINGYSKLVYFTYLRDLQPPYMGMMQSIYYQSLREVPAGHPTSYHGG